MKVKEEQIRELEMRAQVSLPPRPPPRGICLIYLFVSFKYTRYCISSLLLDTESLPTAIAVVPLY